MRRFPQHGRNRAQPFAVEIERRWFAFALFLWAGSIATTAKQCRPHRLVSIVAPFFSERSNATMGT
jgi:hypothetical protein